MDPKQHAPHSYSEVLLLEVQTKSTIYIKYKNKIFNKRKISAGIRDDENALYPIFTVHAVVGFPIDQHKCTEGQIFHLHNQRLTHVGSRYRLEIIYMWYEAKQEIANIDTVEKLHSKPKQKITLWYCK